MTTQTVPEPTYREPIPVADGHTETAYPDAHQKGSFVGVLDHDGGIGIHTRYAAGPHAVILLTDDDARQLAAEITRRLTGRRPNPVPITDLMETS
jgi:hypothetical protein